MTDFLAFDFEKRSEKVPEIRKSTFKCHFHVSIFVKTKKTAENRTFKVNVWYMNDFFLNDPAFSAKTATHVSCPYCEESSCRKAKKIHRAGFEKKCSLTNQPIMTRAILWNLATTVAGPK